MDQQKTTDYLLKQVSTDIIENAQTISQKQKHHVKYDVANWLNFKSNCSSPLVLQLRIQDSKKVHQIEVDRVNCATQGQVLFSGQVSIRCEGPINSMQLLLVSQERNLPFDADEVFIQKAAERPVRQRPQLLYAVA